MIKRLILGLLCCSLLFNSGCWDLRIVEELALAFAIGFDLDEEDKELLTVTTTNPVFSDTATHSTNKTTVQGYTFSQAYFNAQRQHQNFLVLGQVGVLVFSEEMARTGRMHEVMVEVDQQMDMNPNASLAIVRGDPAQYVLQLEPSEETRVAVYLMNLLEKNVNNGLIPHVTASRYWFRQSDPGISSVVPLVEITGHEDDRTGLLISGLAVMDASGSMVGNLGDSDIPHYLMLTQQPRRSRFYTQVDVAGQNDVLTSVLIKRANRKVRSKIIDNRVHFHVSLEADIDILDMNAKLDALEDGIFDEIETQLARDIQGNALDMLRRTQRWRSDILGLGRFVRVQHPKWFSGVEEWCDYYENAEISLEVRVNLRRIGTLTNPEY